MGSSYSKKSNLIDYLTAGLKLLSLRSNLFIS